MGLSIRGKIVARARTRAASVVAPAAERWTEIPRPEYIFGVGRWSVRGTGAPALPPAASPPARPSRAPRSPPSTPLRRRPGRRRVGAGPHGCRRAALALPTTSGQGSPPMGHHVEGASSIRAEGSSERSGPKARGHRHVRCRLLRMRARGLAGAPLPVLYQAAFPGARLRGPICQRVRRPSTSGPRQRAKSLRPDQSTAGRWTPSCVHIPPRMMTPFDRLSATAIEEAA